MSATTSALRNIALRFKEPSSWAGLAGLVALLGISVDPGLMQSAAMVGAGLAGIAAILIPEDTK